MTAETGTVPMPTWLRANLFEELLSKRYGGNYAGIKSFKPEAGLKPGENYSTIMLRLKLEVELQGECESQVNNGTSSRNFHHQITPSKM